VPRGIVAAGTVRIIMDGAGTYHGIEKEYIRPEVHSLMKVDRPVVRARDLDRVVLLVSGPLAAIKGTYAYKYIKHGEEATYASKKSRAVPVPQRSTCAARHPWYDLTGLVDPGFAFWPKSQQYRHIIPGNPSKIVCNCNLYDLGAKDLNKDEQKVLLAVLNSTVVGLFKTFYGRYAGTEGNLKTEVIDVNLIDVPDPRGATASVAKRLTDSLKSMCKRDIGGFVETSLKECHTYARALEISSETVYFGKGRRQHIVCQSRGEAELVARMASLGVSGEVCVPKLNPNAMKLLHFVNARHEKVEKRLRELAASRSGDSDTQEQVFKLLERWYVVGKPAAGARTVDDELKG